MKFSFCALIDDRAHADKGNMNKNTHEYVFMSFQKSAYVALCRSVY